MVTENIGILLDRRLHCLIEMWGGAWVRDVIARGFCVCSAAPSEVCIFARNKFPTSMLDGFLLDAALLWKCDILSQIPITLSWSYPAESAFTPSWLCPPAPWFYGLQSGRNIKLHFQRSWQSGRGWKVNGQKRNAWADMITQKTMR